jgi:hypothetical protein
MWYCGGDAGTNMLMPATTASSLLNKTYEMNPYGFSDPQENPHKTLTRVSKW